MKKYFIITALLFSVQSALATQCISGGQQVEVHKLNNEILYISRDRTEKVPDEGFAEEDNISCADVNFDGETDILVEHRPTGQVKMSSVFIYEKADGLYKKINR